MAASPGYGVDLGTAIENVHATIELAARQGLTQARIQLEPAELGSIRIHLTQTAAGLLARVSAESAAASQALAAAHGELRQSLAGIGVDLARLHVGTHASTTADADGRGAGEQAAGEPAAGGAGADRRDPGAQGSAGRQEANGEAQTGEGGALAEGAAGMAAAPEPHTSDAGTAEHEAYAPGALVDVLA